MTACTRSIPEPLALEPMVAMEPHLSEREVFRIQLHEDHEELQTWRQGFVSGWTLSAGMVVDDELHLKPVASCINSPLHQIFRPQINRTCNGEATGVDGSARTDNIIRCSPIPFYDQHTDYDRVTTSKN